MANVKIWIVVSIIALLMGLASPLPIWPGPLLFRHLPPAIFSGILMMLSCLMVRKEGSRAVGIVSIIYGTLATIGAALLLIIFIALLENEWLLKLSATLGVAIGLAVLILGIRIIRLKQRIA